MALLRSANFLETLSYKHLTPPECGTDFAGAYRTLEAKPIDLAFSLLLICRLQFFLPVAPTRLPIEPPASRPPKFAYAIRRSLPMSQFRYYVRSIVIVIALFL